MGLTNVDDKELRQIFVLLVEFFKRVNLPLERGSGITPEDQYDGLPAKKPGYIELFFPIQGFQCESRGHIPLFRCAVIPFESLSLGRSAHRDKDKNE